MCSPSAFLVIIVIINMLVVLRCLCCLLAWRWIRSVSLLLQQSVIYCYSPSTVSALNVICISATFFTSCHCLVALMFNSKSRIFLE